MEKAKIIFFGTSEFAVPALEALQKEGYEIVAVITTPDEPAGRKQELTPSPVKLAAQRLSLPILQPATLKDTAIPKADLGVVAAYGKIIPQTIIDAFPLGIINIHPSLLPKYRGASPIQYALLNGEKKTGVAIMKNDAHAYPWSLLII